VEVSDMNFLSREKRKHQKSGKRITQL